MSIIEPKREKVEQPSEKKKYSASLRLWHWASVLLISGSLITVLINSTLFDRQTSAEIIKRVAGENLNTETIRSIGHEFEDSVWSIHIYFGYALSAFFLFRMGLEYFQLADQRFIRRLKIAWFYYKQNKNLMLAKHEIAVKGIYIFYYLTLLIMVITGLTLAFEDSVPISREVRHYIKEFHGFCMYIIIAFIIIHIVGIIMAERRDSAGIVSDMINGGHSDA